MNEHCELMARITDFWHSLPSLTHHLYEWGRNLSSNGNM